MLLLLDYINKELNDKQAKQKYKSFNYNDNKSKLVL